MIIHKAVRLSWAVGLWAVCKTKAGYLGAAQLRRAWDVVTCKNCLKKKPGRRAKK